MNESLKNWDGGGWVRVDFARKLEHSRDEVMEELRQWQTLRLWGGTPEHIDDFIKGQQTRIHEAQDIEKICEQLECERDETQAAIRALAEHGESEIQRLTKERDEWAAMCGRYKQERDEAREAFVIATDQMVVAQCKLRESNKERYEAREQEQIHHDNFAAMEKERDEAIQLLKLCADYSLTTHQEQVEKFLKKTK